MVYKETKNQVDNSKYLQVLTKGKIFQIKDFQFFRPFPNIKWNSIPGDSHLEPK